MARTRNFKRRAPRARAAISRAARATKKQSNLANSCSEDCTLFSEDLDVDAILNNESGDLPERAPLSKEVSPCSNAAAHQNGPHYICTNCSLLANTYLQKDPHGLLHSGHPFIKGQRFFPLCKKCIKKAGESAKQGCLCDCLDETLCFKCKRDKLYLATAKRDAEVERVRLGFGPWGETARNKWQFMRPVLSCVCGEEELEVGDGKEGVLRCAGCEGTVMKTGGRVWDPFARAFVKIREYGTTIWLAVIFEGWWLWWSEKSAFIFSTVASIRLSVMQHPWPLPAIRLCH